MSNEIKDTEKDEAVAAKAAAKAKADAAAEAKAVAKAAAEAEVEAAAEVEAKAKADAKKVANPTRRVFRQAFPRKMRNTIIKTLMEYGRTVGEQRIPGRLAELSPNNANQYVLGAGAIEYGKQLGVVLARVVAGDLIEVDASTESTPFITKDEKELAATESKARALRKKLGVSEPNV